MLHSTFLKLKLQLLTLTFFVSGHSQNENDNAHSLIEGKSRTKKVYTTSQWESVIDMAFIANDVKVNRITHKDIIDFKSKEGLPTYTNVLQDKKNIDGNKIYWSKIMSVMFRNDSKEMIHFK